MEFTSHTRNKRDKAKLRTCKLAKWLDFKKDKISKTQILTPNAHILN